MPIIAYGYGIDQIIAPAGGDNLVMELQAEPDVFLEPEVQIEVSADDIDISVDDDTEIEVD
jgi:hypothetical protein